MLINAPIVSSMQVTTAKPLVTDIFCFRRLSLRRCWPIFESFFRDLKSFQKLQEFVAESLQKYSKQLQVWPSLNTKYKNFLIHLNRQKCIAQLTTN